MADTILVRAPQAPDEPAWRRLWAAYLDFYAMTVPPEATEHTWSRILDPAGPMFGRVAVLESAMVGFTICVVHEGTWSVNPTCYLEDLFVDPAARRAGLGRALLDDLVALGGQNGWSSLYWHTRADNTPARKLYDRYIQADDFVRYRLAFPPKVSNELGSSN